jgi:MraZ protein
MSEKIIDLKNEFRHNVDAKKRLFIPAKHRDMMEGDFVICRSIRGNCLKVYPREEWERFTTKAAEVGGSKGEALRHYIYRFSIDGEPDSQGRVVLNEGLIEHAQLKREAVILGLGRYAEIWSAELYEAEVLKECREDIIDIADEFGF